MATAGVSSLFMGVAPAGAATVDACGDGVLIAPGVCEQTFNSGSAAFTPTADMTKLEVLLVGAGGAGADQPVPNTYGYAAAGGGGEVKIVDFSGATAPLNLTVAAPGVSGNVSDGTTSAAVANGTNGLDATGGSSGSGFAGANGYGDTAAPYGAGGGAAGSPTTRANGGAGVVVSTLAPSGSLFSDDATCYGGGGAIGTPTVQGIPGCGGSGPADPTGTTLAAPVANSGGGGGGLNITQSSAARAGANGVVVIRWNGATAALTFDANGHGVAPAPQAVVAGTAAVRPTDPTASGWEFRGWYTDAQLTTLADFSAPLTSATTYYAAWAPALAATGSAPAVAALPIAIAILFAGAGLVAVTYNRKRRAD